MKGKGDKVTKRIAKKHGVSDKVIKKELVMGKDVEEKEHGSKKTSFPEIAKDHVKERSDYYKMLLKLEKAPVKISGREDYKKYDRKG